VDGQDGVRSRTDGLSTDGRIPGDDLASRPTRAVLLPNRTDALSCDVAKWPWQMGLSDGAGGQGVAGSNPVVPTA
jgi:hypothetical protein